MTDALQKEIKLEVQLPSEGFPKVLYFNRFRVDRDNGFTLAQFGLVVASDLVDHHSCVFSENVLKQNEIPLLDYLNRIGRPAELEPSAWKGVTAIRSTDVADIISMAYRGDVAETAFYLFSLVAATRGKKGAERETALKAQPLLLLRSTSELQKQLIVSLYEN